jgi:hypothetical protein
MKKFIEFGCFSQPFQIGLANPKESDLATIPHSCVGGERKPLRQEEAIAEEVIHVVSNPESNNYLFINSPHFYAFRTRFSR